MSRIVSLLFSVVACVAAFYASADNPSLVFAGSACLLSVRCGFRAEGLADGLHHFGGQRLADDAADVISLEDFLGYAFQHIQSRLQ